MSQAQLPGIDALRLPTGKEFERQVLDAAKYLGWLRAHFRAVNVVKRGWMTPVQADGKGFPDLVLVGHGQCLFRELKVGRGQLEPAQRVWRDHLLKNGQDWALWTPQDWPQIITELGGKVAA